MTSLHSLRAIPTDDRAWLIAALADALGGGAPVLPVAPGTPDGELDALHATPLPAGTALVIRTSGSSGVPKAVALSAAALVASAEATHERFGGPGQWLVTLPSHLVSGVQMLVRSAIAGTDPVFFDGPFDAAAFLDAAERMDGDRRYVSLVPVQFSRLLDVAEAQPEAAEIMRRFDAVLVGGQAVSLEMRRRAHELGIALKRSYGMTETAGGCVYDGVEIGDTRVRIRAGEVQLAGPSLALGYVGDPALTSEKFFDDTDRHGETTRWFRTGDAGDLLGGMLTVSGRIDRVLISGGVNVSLDRIEEVVRELPGWATAVALPVDHPEWGQRPTLVVEGVVDEPRDAGATETDATPDSTQDTTPGATFDEVRAAVRDALGAAAVPEWANHIAELPRLAGGKPDLVAIEAWVSRLRASFREAAASSQTIESETPTTSTDSAHREAHA